MAISKGEFVEISFTGRVNGAVFDSNIKEDLKELDAKAEVKKMVVCVGERMLVKGFDAELEGKEIGKKYEIHIPFKDGFGPRRQDLVKTIPLKVFTAQNIHPRPGSSFVMDGMLARVITVSGARVITDFNNPLAGKDLDYSFTIKRKVDDRKEMAESLFDFFFRFVPEMEVSDKLTVKGPKQMEDVLNIFKERFEKLLGFSIVFLEAKPEKATAPETSQ